MDRTGTALTRIGSKDTTDTTVLVAGERAACAFTAQLLAVRHDSPTFRQRRRIEPLLGAAAYRDSLWRTAQALTVTSTRI